jgi:hypothetical protein
LFSLPDWRLSQRCNRVVWSPWTRRFVIGEVVTDPETLNIKAARSFETSDITNCTAVRDILGCAWHRVAWWILHHSVHHRRPQYGSVLNRQHYRATNKTANGALCDVAKTSPRPFPFTAHAYFGFKNALTKKAPPSANAEGNYVAI